MTMDYVYRRLCLLLLPLLISCAALAASGPWAESYRFERQGEYSKAISVLDEELAGQAEDDFASLRVAWLQYLAKNYQGSIASYKKALALNPQSLEARLGLTLPLLAQKKWREATLAAKQVLEKAPWNYYAHVRLMVAAEGEQKWKSLAQHARKVSARYPSDATVLVYLARAEHKLGHVKSAQTVYQQVLQRIPGHMEASAYLANSER